MAYKCSICANNEGCYDSETNFYGCEYFRLNQPSKNEEFDQVLKEEGESNG